MKYENIYPATFIDRPNRFIANILVDKDMHVCHVKNTGRCKELLVPGVNVYVQKALNPTRKTQWDLIAVEKTSPNGTRLINMDSQAPNKVAEEWLKNGGLGDIPLLIKPECRYGDSRFDFYVELPGKRRLFMEVKGCTLEVNGDCYFPDAPTDRGLKHITELESCLSAGYEAVVLFVIQMKSVNSFAPNRSTHPAFADALQHAEKRGVKILAYDCLVSPTTLEIDTPVPIRL